MISNRHYFGQIGGQIGGQMVGQIDSHLVRYRVYNGNTVITYTRYRYMLYQHNQIVGGWK